MRARQIIIVIRPIQVRRHTADKVISILPLKELAHLKPGNLCDRIRLVRLLKRSCQKRILRDWLGRHLGINAGAPEKKQLFHPKIMTAFDHITLNLHILVGKFCRRRIVGIDAADLCRRKHHYIRPLLCKKISHCLLACKVELLVRPTDQVGVSLLLKISDNSRAHKSPVPCYIDFI